MRFSGTRCALRWRSVHAITYGTGIANTLLESVRKPSGWKSSRNLKYNHNPHIVPRNYPARFDLTGYTVVERVSPRERRGSLMVLRWRGVVQRDVVWRVVVARVVVVIIRIRIIVVVLSGLRCLPLRVLLVLHSSVLKPYFHLSLCQV